MIAVLKGDIVASRKLANQDLWLLPLKELLEQWGSTPEDWEIVWGDFFQVQISNPADALQKAFEIKTLIKSMKAADSTAMTSIIDVRMAIGIGEKSYSAPRISESNGTAFIYSGEKFDLLKKEDISIGVKSPWQAFDDDINLHLRLADTFMDRWTVSAAELAKIVLQNPGVTQEEIGRRLGIKQSGVSGRWSRAYIDEILKIESAFRKKIELLLP
ncbi:hypothetical protein [Algoriphagus terrigena]|uniref:hypothetical protein n=1 Tax=Algoriphagus terrigena TaxID=344884 RepID=UPI0003FACE30|nr:hypothetical protein [Algoriphagus terrigena]